MEADMPVEWREWGEEAFEEARRLGRPVLLFLYASWCRFSRRMREEVLADPEVAAFLGQRFVAVAVDKDRHPEVDRRYSLGGWPTVAVLTPEGELLTGDTTFTPDRLRTLLERVARLWSEDPEGVKRRIAQLLEREREEEERRATRRGELTEEIVRRVEDAIVSHFDEEHGGFGTGQKFPHWEAIDFALLRYVETGDERLRRVAEVTLEKMARAPIHDAVEGGFFRFSASRDWRDPHTEKLLETNVGLLRNYLEASQVFGRSDFRAVAERIVRFLVERMRHPEREAFVGSIDSDDAYYSLAAAERAARDRPAVDETVYVHWNAAAVSALFKASAVLDDDAIARCAERTLEYLLEEAYDRGRGMYHFLDGGRHLLGLLADQAYTARALLHAAQFTGDRRYLEVCEDLVRLVMEKQRGTGGAFDDYRTDRPANARLRRRNQSILENGLMAEVLLRTHYLTARPEYLDTARRSLEVFADEYHLYGYATAGYARAVELYLHPPVHVIVVGPRSHPASRAMVRRASELYLPSKLVQVVDPAQDEDLLRAFQLPPETEPRAYVIVRGAHVGRVSTPEELVQLMRRTRGGGEA